MMIGREVPILESYFSPKIQNINIFLIMMVERKDIRKGTQDGIPGQKNTYTEKSFTNHVLIKVPCPL